VLIIDNQKIGQVEFRQRHRQMEQLAEYRNPAGKRYAICLKHAFDLLAAVMYIREREGSVLLIHADTPLGAAKDIALRADCTYLLYDNGDNVLSVCTSSSQYSPCLLQYSSGTTGSPTLIARTWQQIETEIKHYNELFSGASNEKPIVLAPVSHSYGLITGVLSALAREVQPTIIQGMNLKLGLHTIKSSKEHILYTVPFVYNVLDSLDRGNLHCHKVVLSGAPPTEMSINRLKETTNEVWQQYGCTEVGCISVAKNPHSLTDVGEPLNHLQVTIRTGADHWDRGQGEVVVTIGSNVTATRDLGYVDSLTGRLQLVGRIDDLINVGGLKVIPAELETVMGRMPGIKECIVVKTKHKIWGEAVRALVVADPFISEQDVRLWCIDHLSTYKVPSVIELVSEIPRMPSGKVSRHLLQGQERS
jgi:acyl-coenzyme A synthetase/AMP-(fatty) acid ligase